MAAPAVLLALCLAVPAGAAPSEQHFSFSFQPEGGEEAPSLGPALQGAAMGVEPLEPEGRREDQEVRRVLLEEARKVEEAMMKMRQPAKASPPPMDYKETNDAVLTLLARLLGQNEAIWAEDSPPDLREKEYQLSEEATSNSQGGHGWETNKALLALLDHVLTQQTLDRHGLREPGYGHEGFRQPSYTEHDYAGPGYGQLDTSPQGFGQQQDFRRQHSYGNPSNSHPPSFGPGPTTSNLRRPLVPGGETSELMPEQHIHIHLESLKQSLDNSFDVPPPDCHPTGYIYIGPRKHYICSIDGEASPTEDVSVRANRKSKWPTEQARGHRSAEEEPTRQGRAWPLAPHWSHYAQARAVPPLWHPLLPGRYSKFGQSLAYNPDHPHHLHHHIPKFYTLQFGSDMSSHGVNASSRAASEEEEPLFVLVGEPVRGCIPVPFHSLPGVTYYRCRGQPLPGLPELLAASGRAATMDSSRRFGPVSVLPGGLAGHHGAPGCLPELVHRVGGVVYYRCRNRPQAGLVQVLDFRPTALGWSFPFQANGRSTGYYDYYNLDRYIEESAKKGSGRSGRGLLAEVAATYLASKAGEVVVGAAAAGGRHVLSAAGKLATRAGSFLTTGASYNSNHLHHSEPVYSGFRRSQYDRLQTSDIIQAGQWIEQPQLQQSQYGQPSELRRSQQSQAPARRCPWGPCFQG